MQIRFAYLEKYAVFIFLILTVVLSGCIGAEKLAHSGTAAVPTINPMFEEPEPVPIVDPTTEWLMIQATLDWYEYQEILAELQWDGNELTIWEYDKQGEPIATVVYQNEYAIDVPDGKGGVYVIASSQDHSGRLTQNKTIDGDTVADEGNVDLSGDANNVRTDDPNTNAAVISMATQPPAEIATTKPDTSIDVVIASVTDSAAHTPSAMPTPTMTLTAEPSPTTMPGSTPIPSSTPTPSPTLTPTPTPTPICGGNDFNKVGTTSELAQHPIDFETFGSWTRGQSTYGSFLQTDFEKVSGRSSGWICYYFATEMDDTAVFMQFHPIRERANKVTMWVYGNYSSHYMNVWILDAEQETWQIPLGTITHHGWKEMEAVFVGPGAVELKHISGPENGRIDFPIRFRGVALNDRWDEPISHGNIYVDDITFVNE